MNSVPASEKSGSGIRVSPSVVGSLVLLVAFFLPWVSFLGSSVGGYQISQLSGEWKWVWAIPVISGIAVLLGVAGKRHTEIGQIAGALPLLALGIALRENGKDLLSGLLFGAWLSIITGALLVVVPLFLRKPAPAKVG